MQTVSSRWLPALVASHFIVNTVEVWEAGNLLGRLPISSGSVTDAWVSGTRRSISMTTQATDPVKSMIHPGVELRPYSGIDYRSGPLELLALGCFPVTDDIDTSRPNQPLTLNCQDRWQLVYAADFVTPRSTNPALTIVAQVVQFLVEVGQWTASQIDMQFTSSVPVVAQTFDTSPGGRATACIDLLKTIGAEVFVNRQGNPVIRYRQAAGSPAAVFAPGVRQKDLSATRSTANVYNVVYAFSTSIDPAFPALSYTARITDPTHPAYPRPGVPIHPISLSSPQFTTALQLKNAAQKELSRISREARQISIVPTAPDPSLNASDTVTAIWASTGVSENQQIQQIVHPLTLTDNPAITCVSSRSSEDFNP
jgi:hypothetical protein